MLNLNEQYLYNYCSSLNLPIKMKQKGYDCILLSTHGVIMTTN